MATPCPGPCQCSPGKVNCTRAGLTSWPPWLPPDTTTLILSHNDIGQVSTEHLAPLAQLKTLVLAHNRIGSMEVSDAQHALENVDVSHNELQDVDFASALPALRHLNVAFNRLTVVDNDTLAANPRLRWLSLYGNPVTRLDPKALSHTELIEYLSLSALDVTELPAGLLRPLARLRQLEIRDNALLTEIYDDAFQFQGALQHLNLANNSLAAIPRSIRRLDALRSLNLDDNPFECDCSVFWFAHWLDKRAGLHVSQNMVCDDGRPLLDRLSRLRCTTVRLETSTLFQQAELGQPVVLTCNFSGNPPPRVTWVTPDRTVLRWAEDTAQQDVSALGGVMLLTSGQLQVSNLSRHTAGDYACHASNALSNVTAFMRVHITPSSFRRVQIQSILTGFGCVLGFVLITFLVQGFRYLMDR